MCSETERSKFSISESNPAVDGVVATGLALGEDVTGIAKACQLDPICGVAALRAVQDGIRGRKRGS